MRSVTGFIRAESARLHVEWNGTAYEPAYWETSIPAADSSVLVRKSSSEASPSQ